MINNKYNKIIIILLSVLILFNGCDENYYENDVIISKNLNFTNYNIAEVNESVQLYIKDYGEDFLLTDVYMDVTFDKSYNILKDESTYIYYKNLSDFFSNDNIMILEANIDISDKLLNNLTIFKGPSKAKFGFSTEKIDIKCTENVSSFNIIDEIYNNSLLPDNSVRALIRVRKYGSYIRFYDDADTMISEVDISYMMI